VVNTVLHGAVRRAVGQIAPLAIGMAVTVSARRFVTGIYGGLALYVVAQLLGGVVAGVL
jgi:hypothetical protein